MKVPTLMQPWLWACFTHAFKELDVTGDNIRDPGEGDSGKAPGAGAIMWDTYSDLTLAPFSTTILVMQAAHPDIGAAVARFSVYQREPWGRLFRTGFSLMRFMYGGKGGRQSEQEAHSLRALHANIKGTHADGSTYYALKPATFRIVLDTFLDGVVRIRKVIGQPLTQSERDKVYREYLDLCRLFGLRYSDLEPTLDEFETYYEAMLLAKMSYNETVRFLLEEMLVQGPAVKYFPLPGVVRRFLYQKTIYPLLRIFTLGFLDARFRQSHAINWSNQDEVRFQKYVSVLCLIRKYTPRWLRYNPISLYIMAGGHGPRSMNYERLKVYLENR